MAATQQTLRVRELNDLLRTQGKGGMVVQTPGIASSPPGILQEIFHDGVFRRLQFRQRPWGEHDCAVLQVGDVRVIWKIDYYKKVLDLFVAGPGRSLPYDAGANGDAGGRILMTPAWRGFHQKHQALVRSSGSSDKT